MKSSCKWHLGEFVLCEAKIIQIRVIIHAHRDVAGHGKESEHHEVQGQSDSPVFVGEIRNAKRDEDTVWNDGPRYIGQKEYDTQNHANERGNFGAGSAVTFDICVNVMRGGGQGGVERRT